MTHAPSSFLCAHHGMLAAFMTLLLVLAPWQTVDSADAVVVDASGNTAVNGALTVGGNAQFTQSIGLTPAVAAGAPTVGSWTKGALHTDVNCDVWQCTANGTPGTWRKIFPVTVSGGDNVAKAWMNFDGSGANGAVTPRAQFNIASVVKNVAGDYTVTFATPLANANYVVTCGFTGITHGLMAQVVYSEMSNTGFKFSVVQSGATGFKFPNNAMVLVFGN